MKDLVKELWITNKVNFLWKKDHNELPNIYNSNNVYILPSSNEWMSNTLLEAMASSMPVIVTDVWWTKELFNNNGWIIKFWDIEDIREKLEFAYKKWQDWKLEELWNKSYEIVSFMSWESKAKEFLKIL